MALSLAEVEHVALLARLTLSENEKELFAQQLGAILEYVDKLRELPTDDIEPLSHILPVFNVFREDHCRPSPSREETMANAALVEDKQYRVPRII